MEVGARPRSILDQTIGDHSTDFFFKTIGGKEGTVPYRDNGHSQRILHALGIPDLFRASLSWREQNNRERPGRPAQGSRLSHTRVSRISFRSWFGSGPSRSFSYRGKGKESKSMDINEPSLMDVAHDTINSTRRSGANRSSLLSLRLAKQGFFRSKSGWSHEI